MNGFVLQYTIMHCSACYVAGICLLSGLAIGYWLGLEHGNMNSAREYEHGWFAGFQLGTALGLARGRRLSRDGPGEQAPEAGDE